MDRSLQKDPIFNQVASSMTSSVNTKNDDQADNMGRLHHLLKSARGAFMKHGYQHMSVDSISRRSGVSKETIYRHFPDKSALFRAAMKGSSDEFRVRIADIIDESAQPQTVFENCARAINDRAADSEHPSPNWLAVGTANSFPELAREVFLDSFEGIAALKGYFARIASSLGITGQTSLDIISQFGALAVEGPGHLMGWPPLSESEREKSAIRVADLFMNGYMVKQKSAAEEVSYTAAQHDFDAVIPAPPPVQGEHIAKLMCVAREQFYEHGYRGTNIEEIGTIARVGRGTLYRHFGNKSGLFEATMTEAAQQIMQSCRLSLSTGSSIESNLLNAAMATAEVLLSRECILLYRTVIAEAKSLPHVSRQVYSLTRDPLVEPLSNYLKICASHGLLRIDDAEWAAMQFMTLATGGNRYLVLNPSLDSSERQHTAKLAVSTFLHGYTGASRT